MHPFSTPLKNQKSVRFSDVFRGERKGCIGNEWVKIKTQFSDQPKFFCFQKFCRYFSVKNHLSVKLGNASSTLH